MSFKEKIQADIKKSMQNKDALKVSVLRLAMANIINKEKEKRAKLNKAGDSPAGEKDKLDELSKLTDEEIMEVLSSEAKKRKDSIEQYRKGNREDLAEQEEKELDILSDYLPEQINEEEIRKIVKQKIEELGVSTLQETGKVMGAVMPQLKGKADGNVISRIVQEELKN
ncbi:GatB/YqeY domain-containing protein [Patescibacteria group bacterium]|nr:GatB/YqeY domain-containing protein [Patescibacteria group bacterium]MBU2472725.1 GatB/YqeY domain-containing protein [Patescibacteria group bacterium]